MNGEFYIFSVSVSGDDYGSDDSELRSALEDLDSNWYLGLEEEPGWQEAVLKQRPNLFSVSATDRQLFRSHLLTLTR